MEKSVERLKKTDLFVPQNPVDFGALINRFLGYMENNAAESADLLPKIQVIENGNAVNVMAEIPGINEKDIDLSVSTDGYLCISGEKKNDSDIDSENNYFSEILYGKFRRTIQLPWDLDYEQTTAKYHNGVLFISIPKSVAQKQKFKKINVMKS